MNDVTTSWHRGSRKNFSCFQKQGKKKVKVNSFVSVSVWLCVIKDTISFFCHTSYKKQRALMKYPVTLLHYSLPISCSFQVGITSAVPLIFVWWMILKIWHDNTVIMNLMLVLFFVLYVVNRASLTLFILGSKYVFHHVMS